MLADLQRVFRFVLIVDAFLPAHARFEIFGIEIDDTHLMPRSREAPQRRVAHGRDETRLDRMGMDQKQFHRLLTNRPIERSEEHTSELQSLMRISYAVFCLKKKKTEHKYTTALHLTTNHLKCHQEM